MKKINLILNGESRTAAVAPHEVLLDVLREKLGVKSPKVGCERGDCGACTILLDGKPVCSCLILAVEVDGQEITTLEGVGRNGPTPLQQSFIRHNAFQCGFCAPGIVLAATALLEKNPQPSAHEAQEALSGNLCRCTGYEAIIESVVEAGREGGGKKKSRKGQ
ncbi:MAG: (2Fe-2S)-binding protein [Verrucomicrobia bacterium]|nr:(2Fe-2S)-binding protein [Verrucomicrobiota bacterium]MBU1910694.1 (2Fe-2S)-binding protein [Verrucomicrobiota bacterium]